MTDCHIDSLLDHHKRPDVALANEYVSPCTAQEIWKRLRSLHPDAFTWCDHAHECRLEAR
jgi:hypothetical protein